MVPPSKIEEMMRCCENGHLTTVYTPCKGASRKELLWREKITLEQDIQSYRENIKSMKEQLAKVKRMLSKYKKPFNPKTGK